jgi:hypothetical protein
MRRAATLSDVMSVMLTYLASIDSHGKSFCASDRRVRASGFSRGDMRGGGLDHQQRHPRQSLHQASLK